MPRKHKPRSCLGWGETRGRCANPAGTKWSAMWCEECNTKRMDHISGRLDRLKAQLQ